MAREFSKKFYKSKVWKKCREGYIASVFGLCERCREPGYILHHKIELNEHNINDPDVTLRWDNLEYLCLDCHNREHDFGRDERTYIREGLMFNGNGDVVKI